MTLKLFYQDNNAHRPVSTYGGHGYYHITAEQDGDVTPVTRAKYFPAFQGAKTVVIYPGYRMRGTGGFATNTLAKMLNSQGHAVLLFDYSGFTHNQSDEIDDATLSSNISDARAALSFLGHAQRIDLSISYGVNVAMHTGDNDRLLGSVSIVPAPDFIQHIVVDRMDLQALHERGFVRTNNRFELKCTAGFLEDAVQYSTLNTMAAYARKPFAVIATREDDVYPPALLREWVEALRQSQALVNVRVLDGVGHEIDERFVLETLHAVRMIADNAGMHHILDMHI